MFPWEERTVWGTQEDRSFGKCYLECAPSADRNSIRTDVVRGCECLSDGTQIFYKRSKMQNILNTSRLKWNMHEMSLSLHEKNALKT